MADNELEKIERTKKALIYELKSRDKLYKRDKEIFDVWREKYNLAKKAGDKDKQRECLVEMMSSQDMMKISRQRIIKEHLADKYNLGKNVAEELIEFVSESFQINPYIDEAFVKSAAEYFKDPIDTNLTELQPEFERVMAIRNQKKIIRTELINSLEYIIKDRRTCKVAGYVLNTPPSMYNLSSQLESYSDAVQSKEYNKSIEAMLLNKMISHITFPKIMEHLKESRRANIIALGCGPGIHEYQFALDFIEQKDMNYKNLRLYLTDINQSMINRAVVNAENENLKRIKGGKPPIDIKGVQVDFFQIGAGLRGLNYEITSPGVINIFLMLGSTLGNFYQIEQRQILSSVCNVMGGSDSFVLGVKGFHTKNGKINKAKIEDEYKTSGVEDFAFAPLSILGIPRCSLGEYKVNLDLKSEFHVMEKQNPRYTITCSFIVGQKIEIDADYVGPANEEGKIVFNVGDKLTIVSSERFTKKKLENLVKLDRSDKDYSALREFQGGLLKLKRFLSEEGSIIGLYKKQYTDKDDKNVIETYGL